MKRTQFRKRSKKMAVAFGAVLVTASCATATTQITDTQGDRGSRYDNGVEQLLLYCGKLRDNGELPTAASICDRAHSIDPTDPRPLIMMGNIFLEMERLPQAASAYLVVLEQAPHNVEARYLLGKTYIAMGRHDLALQELQFASTQDPKDARIFNALGIANGMLGNRIAARQAFEEGLTVAPNDIPLRNNLGLALVLNGKHKEGIAVLQKVALDPKANATTIRNLQLAEGIAQSANANQAVADASPPKSASESTPKSASESTPEITAMPAGSSQIASTATVPSDFSLESVTESEPVMAEAQMGTAEVTATPSQPRSVPTATVPSEISSDLDAEFESIMAEAPIETPETIVTPSQPPSVPREPVTLTEALSPLPEDIQMADGGMPVYLGSDSSTGELETFAMVDEKQNDSMDTPPAELEMASVPQPILAPEPAPELEQPASEKPAATGEMLDIVTASVDTVTPPKAPPGDMQTAALESEDIYSVQLASYRSSERAQAGWEQIRASALDLLQDVEPVIRRSDLGPEKGIYFRLRTKRYSKDIANQLCSALQSRGLSCLTIRENEAALAAPDESSAPAALEETTMPAAAKS